MADAECKGPQGGGPADPPRGDESGPCGGDGRIFAPGPGDLDGWGRVVADGDLDWRAPATQPGVRVLVDGVALVVDASRADQLRCGGNGVVPLQAAVALRVLLARACQ